MLDLNSDQSIGKYFLGEINGNWAAAWSSIEHTQSEGGGGGGFHPYYWNSIKWP